MLRLTMKTESKPCSLLFYWSPLLEKKCRLFWDDVNRSDMNLIVFYSRSLLKVSGIRSGEARHSPQWTTGWCHGYDCSQPESTEDWSRTSWKIKESYRQVGCPSRQKSTIGLIICLFPYTWVDSRGSWQANVRDNNTGSNRLQGRRQGNVRCRPLLVVSSNGNLNALGFFLICFLVRSWIDTTDGLIFCPSSPLVARDG